MSSTNTDTRSEGQPLLSIRQYPMRGCWSHLRVRSKTSLVIILWTVFMGVAYTSFDILTTSFVISNRYYSELDRTVAIPEAILYALLAVVTLLYPIIGFLSDLGCSRFKVVIVSFSIAMLLINEGLRTIVVYPQIKCGELPEKSKN